MSFKTIVFIFTFVFYSNYLMRCQITNEELKSDIQIDMNSDINECSAFDESNGKRCSIKSPDSEAFLYLQKYGYLSEEKSLVEITRNEFSDALIEFQDFIGIEITGVLDDNTIKMMKKERCIEPDVRHSKKRRSKRSLGTHKWIPYNLSAPELWLNWGFNEEVGNQKTYSEQMVDIIENAGKMWTDVANVTLRRPNSTYYKNIVFLFNDFLDNSSNENSSDVKPKFNYNFVRTKRRTAFGIASNFDYDSIDVTIDFPVSEVITTKFKSEALYLFVHIWGHILGLEHSVSPTSVMYPIYEDKTNPVLSTEDITEIQSFYGINPNKNETNLLHLNKDIADDYRNAVDLCQNSTIDSILEIANQPWIIFKNDHYFEIGPYGITSRSPRRISWDFENFVDSVEASFSWNEEVFLFRGNQYFKYRQNKFIEKKNISKGFPGVPDGPFDDIFTWYVNQKTYFFKDGLYWKYDSRLKNVTKGFPKKVSENWKGIPDTFDAAISSGVRNQTYFFKGRQFWRFDDIKKQVIDDSNPPYPRNTDIFLFKCRNRANIPPTPSALLNGTVTQRPIRPSVTYDTNSEFVTQTRPKTTAQKTSETTLTSDTTSQSVTETGAKTTTKRPLETTLTSDTTSQSVIETEAENETQSSLESTLTSETTSETITETGDETTTPRPLRPTVDYDTKPEPTAKPDIPCDTYWVKILIIILVISLVIIVLGGAIFVYIYFFVFKKKGKWTPTQENVAMNERPAPAPAPASGPVQTLSYKPKTEEDKDNVDSMRSSLDTPL